MISYPFHTSSEHENYNQLVVLLELISQWMRSAGFHKFSASFYYVHGESSLIGITLLLENHEPSMHRLDKVGWPFWRANKAKIKMEKISERNMNYRSVVEMVNAIYVRENNWNKPGAACAESNRNDFDAFKREKFTIRILGKGGHSTMLPSNKLTHTQPHSELDS